MDPKARSPSRRGYGWPIMAGILLTTAALHTQDGSGQLRNFNESLPPQLSSLLAASLLHPPLGEGAILLSSGSHSLERALWMALGPFQLPAVGPLGSLDGRHPTPSQFFSLSITEGHIPADLKEARQKSRQPVSFCICEIRESGGQSGAWGSLQLSPSPCLSGWGASHPPPPPPQLYTVNSSWNLLKSITDLWSQPPQRSSAQRAGGLNRNELARGGFATLCVPASLFPFLSFYLTFIIIFPPWEASWAEPR